MSSYTQIFSNLFLFSHCFATRCSKFKTTHVNLIILGYVSYTIMKNENIFDDKMASYSDEATYWCLLCTCRYIALQFWCLLRYLMDTYITNSKLLAFRLTRLYLVREVSGYTTIISGFCLFVCLFLFCFGFFVCLFVFVLLWFFFLFIYFCSCLFFFFIFARSIHIVHYVYF